MLTTPARDQSGRFIKTSTDTTYSTAPTTKSESDEQISTYSITKKRTDPPLLFLRVSNPITYIKRWWKRVVGNEGVEFRLKVRPADSPIIKYIPQLLPAPTSNPWRETAFSGTLRSTNGDIYLLTSESEALSLNIPSNLDLSNYIGKRILAKGLFNENQRLLKIISVENIELLSTKPQKIPTTIPSPTTFHTPTPIPTNTQEEPLDVSVYNNPSM